MNAPQLIQLADKSSRTIWILWSDLGVIWPFKNTLKNHATPLSFWLQVDIDWNFNWAFILIDILDKYQINLHFQLYWLLTVAIASFIANVHHSPRIWFTFSNLPLSFTFFCCYLIKTHCQIYKKNINTI